MFKRDIAEIIKGELALNNKESRRVIDVVLNAIVDGCILHGEVNLRGFGKFKVVKRKSKTVLTPIKKEKVVIPARKALKFTPSKSILLP